MKKHNVEQKSEEWYELRLKCPLTASEAQSIGNSGKGLETLVYEQLALKYSHADRESYSNKDLERGIELEPQARSLYELETGLKVDEVGFITNEDISPVAGCSPDGLVGEEGLLEIKCFDDTKHFRMTLDDFEIESKYVWQVQMQLLITGRKWCDFCAFNPNYKKSLLIKRVLPDKVMHEKLLLGIKVGEKLIKEIENKIK